MEERKRVRMNEWTEGTRKRKRCYDRAKRQKLEKSVLLVCMTDYPEMNKLHDELTKKVQNFFILDHRSGASVFAVNPLTPTNTLTGQEHVNTIFSVFVYCRNAKCAVMPLYICQL